jgi:hypothetical protein
MHEYRLAAADAHAANTYRPMKFRNTSMRVSKLHLRYLAARFKLSKPNNLIMNKP